MINMIASVGQNYELGKNGNLIWPIKKDLKFFRDKTIDHDIVMGRKTFESLPKMLDRRKHIVLTKSNIVIPNAEVRSYIRGIIIDYKDKDVFIIGGSSIYKSFIDYASNIYLTEIEDTCKDADAYFPKFDKEKYERQVIDEDYDEDLKLKYSHVLYKRR